MLYQLFVAGFVVFACGGVCVLLVRAAVVLASVCFVAARGCGEASNRTPSGEKRQDCGLWLLCDAAEMRLREGDACMCCGVASRTRVVCA